VNRRLITHYSQVAGVADAPRRNLLALQAGYSKRVKLLRRLPKMDGIDRQLLKISAATLSTLNRRLAVM
jgi:hypothetical protein